MALASLLAFAGGAGVEPLPSALAASGLLLALFWHPSPELSGRLERLWLPLALLLVLRALFHLVVVRDDVVIPVVDLLLLLLCGEALRSLGAANDGRLYSLSFALLLAATAYRPGLLFALAFVAYVGLATVALMVGHLRREGALHGVQDIPLSRAFLLGMAGLSAVTLLISALVFLAFPRVSRGWAGRGEVTAAHMAGFADEVALGSHGARIVGNPQVVLRVEFPEGAPGAAHGLYWRGRSYDRFDGSRWSRTPSLPPSLTPSAWHQRWGEELVPQRIYGAPLDARVLFALHPVAEIEAESRLTPIVDSNGDVLYWGSSAPVYTAHSNRGRPGPALLREAESGFTPARSFYLQLPPLSQEIRALSDSLTEGLTTRYDRARAVEDWLRREFAYTLDLPRTAQEATLEHFLLRRRAGHCEYFSTAMAVLLRLQGIPTREVNGFLGGEWSGPGNYLAVTQNQAHAWVEVWFPGYGWVPFDPTPAGTGGAAAVSSWLWPGRFFLDALQHRWNKWVLDYSIQTQWGLLERARESFSRTGDSPPGRLPGWLPPVPGAHLWWALGIMGLLAGAVLAAGRRSSHPPETRLYLRLRRASRRAGAPDRALRTPLSLARHLEGRGHPGAPAAREVVEGYLQARFAGEGTGEGAGAAQAAARRKALAGALAQARRALRARPLSASG